MKHKIVFTLLLLPLFILVGCSMNYSFTGASIPPDAKTVSITQFKNNSTMVVATLTETLSDALRDRFQTQTSLSLVDQNGDLQMSGTVTQYEPARPSAISGSETAATNKMTITVKVKFTNTVDPTQDFDKTFSDFVEYNSSIDLGSAQDELIAEVVEKLVDQIFNDAVANW